MTMKTKELNKTMTRRAMKARMRRARKKTTTKKEKKKKRQQRNDELLFLHVYLKYILN